MCDVLNPALWAENDFLILLGVAFVGAAVVAYSISRTRLKPRSILSHLIWREVAALQSADILVNAVEIDLLAQSVLSFDDAHQGHLPTLSPRKTRFINVQSTQFLMNLNAGRLQSMLNEMHLNGATFRAFQLSQTLIHIKSSALNF